MDSAEEWLREPEGMVAPYGGVAATCSGEADSSIALAIAARTLPTEIVP